MSGIDFIQDLGLVMLIAAAAAWLCQRIGLPVVIGYLTAGILISPHTHSFAVISDAGRIQSLAQIGLVFLIFSIGQRIKLQRLKKIGLPLILATVLIAVMVMAGCRLLGTALNWPAEYSLVLGAMLMVSSTTVLGKSLLGAKATHSRFGQTVLTITALDDLVAIVSLTVLTSIIQFGQADSMVVFGTVARLKAVMITLTIGAMLLIPPLLKRLARTVSLEVRSLIIVGLLLAMALLSAKAGLSAALGAFLLGTIVSSTGRQAEVERVLGGLTQVFTPIFFVAMGMLFDFKLLADVWPLAIGVFLFAILWRVMAATTALLMVGHPMGDAARVALCLTPIGEFSLIIVLTGVQGGLVPSSFYPLAIVVCLLTSITTPILIRHSRGLSEWVERKQPVFPAQRIGFYHEWIASLQQRQRSNLLWKLTAPRLIQMAVLMLFVSGLLIFAKPLHSLAEKWLGNGAATANGVVMLLWFSFGVLLLAPLIALWRNVEAVAMICAEACTHGRPKRAFLRPLFLNLFKCSAFIAIGGWLAALVPYEAFSPWGFTTLALAFVALAFIFWRKLIFIQSRVEIELRSQMADSPFADAKSQLPDWHKTTHQWKLNLVEYTIKENTQVVGRPLSELPLRNSFSCTVVRVERQGVMISNPSADTVLYPDDKILLLGQDEALRRAEHWLDSEIETGLSKNDEAELSDLCLQHLSVPLSSRHVGKPLRELALNSLFSIQIVGIERGSDSILSPGRLETLQPKDQLLVLGTSDRINEMALWLAR